MGTISFDGMPMAFMLQEMFEHEELLPRGWRFRMVGYVGNDVILDVDLQSDKGGGSYAEPKIRTLEMDPLAVTTDTNIEQFKRRIQQLTEKVYPTATGYADLPILSGTECEEFITQLSAYTRLEDVPRTILDPIRDRTGISPFGGGIALPCRVQYGAEPITAMKLLVAMSGAKESSDDFLFAMYALREFFNANTTRDICTLSLDIDKMGVLLLNLREQNAEAWRMLQLL